jgi:hypothetical protein
MTLILNGTDNSATTPAVTGTDTDTGVYYPAANQVALATNGTQRLMLDSSGAVFLLNNSYLSFGNNGYIRGDITDSLALQAGASTTVGFQIRNSGNSNAMLSMRGSGGYSLALEGATPAAGIGITFPATANLSSNANTLDDYEEGTFTPTLGGSGSDPTGVTYVAQAATYTRVGNMVTVFAYIAWTTYTGGSNNIQIKGLPFAAVNSTAGGFCNGSTQISAIPLSSGYSWASMRTQPNQTILDMQQQGSGNAWTTVLFSAISSSGTTKEMLTSLTYFLN